MKHKKKRTSGNFMNTGSSWFVMESKGILVQQVLVDNSWNVEVWISHSDPNRSNFFAFRTHMNLQQLRQNFDQSSNEWFAKVDEASLICLYCTAQCGVSICFCLSMARSMLPWHHANPLSSLRNLRHLVARILTATVRDLPAGQNTKTYSFNSSVILMNFIKNVELQF